MEDCLRLPSVFSIARLTLQRPAESLEGGDHFFRPVDALSFAADRSQNAPHILKKPVGVSQLGQQDRDVCRSNSKRFAIIIEHL